MGMIPALPRIRVVIDTSFLFIHSPEQRNPYGVRAGTMFLSLQSNKVMC